MGGWSNGIISTLATANAPLEHYLAGRLTTSILQKNEWSPEKTQNHTDSPLLYCRYWTLFNKIRAHIIPSEAIEVP